MNVGSGHQFYFNALLNTGGSPSPALAWHRSAHLPLEYYNGRDLFPQRDAECAGAGAPHFAWINTAASVSLHCSLPRSHQLDFRNGRKLRECDELERFSAAVLTGQRAAVASQP